MFQKLLETELYRGKSIRFCLDRVRLPGGQTMDQEVLRHPGSVVILPLVGTNNILLLKQYRYIIDREIFEIPAGKLEKEESPGTAAMRELEEETGYTASTIIPLAEIYPTPGYIDEKMHLFLARDLSPAKQDLDPDEIISILTVPVGNVFNMVAEGTIVDGKTIIALFLAREKNMFTIE